MVDFEISSPVVLNLRDYRRPLVGGQKINGCTLGLVGDRQGTRGFITNSHCSSQVCVQDGTAYYQPSSPPSSNLAGLETVDPPCNPGGTGACPSGRLCRDSESSFAVVAGGVSSTRGQIARPPLGSYNWNGTDVFGVAGEQSNILVNDPVTKVGQGSGRKAGKVTATCIDVNFTQNGLNYTIFCQHRADYFSAGGDSGSPVFRIVNWPSQNDVTVYGMHWANNGSTTSYFSSIGRIQFSQELGPIGFCAYGLSC